MAFKNVISQGGGSGSASAPVLVPAQTRYTVPANTQVLFRKRIRIGDAGRIVFLANSVLVETR